jgi:iron(II)-dependent oxidoreductase
MQGLIPAPDNPDDWAAWRGQLHQWRNSTRKLFRYDDTLYTKPEFQWVPNTFTVAFVMMYDLLFYDKAYQLDKILDHGIREFGGYDALLLWHAYPRIGFDDRNQFDFWRQMPGGLSGLRTLVDQCHARDVRVYINYNPWDTGTRHESDSDVDAIVELVRAINADAVFLDTMSNSILGLRERLDEVRPGVTLESEVLTPMEHLATHTSSWAQGFDDVPGVLRNKWFERRHMQHRVRRWNRDHTPELHTAWMNGTGMVVWENVFGSIRLWSARDKSILRSMIGVQRRFANLLHGEGWIPLIQTHHPDLHASRWEDENTRLWTLTNRSEARVSGIAIEVAYEDGVHYFDLITGEELVPQVHENKVQIHLDMPPRGVGALVALKQIPPDWDVFLHQQANIYTRANFDASLPELPQTLHIPVPTSLRQADDLLEDMVAIPRRNFNMTVTFRIRECGFYHVPDVEYPQLRYRYLHQPWSMTRDVELTPYAIDRIPVTNQQFLAFMMATDYVPEFPENFLSHWQDGKPPSGLEDHPVVFVSLEDARAYAKWSGKRLPTEAEWQHAAQGDEQTLYPWGNDWQDDLCNHGQVGSTTPVTAFPGGQSTYGVYDLTGNVWEWTESERRDGRSRFVILKGGSYFQLSDSVWYADGGAQPNDFAAKFLLMHPGLDRCATIGFRCVVDLSE